MMTTERRKQVIKRVEARLEIAPFLVGGNEHFTDCRCVACWEAFESKWNAGQFEVI